MLLAQVPRLETLNVCEGHLIANGKCRRKEAVLDEKKQIVKVPQLVNQQNNNSAPKLSFFLPNVIHIDLTLCVNRTHVTQDMFVFFFSYFYFPECES